MENISEQLVDFYDELPTLRCGEGGCNSCGVAFRIACATMVPAKQKEREAAWEEDTIPSAPAFLSGFDDDYIVQVDEVELGGEG